MRDIKGIREARKEIFAHYFKGKDSYRTLSRLDRYEYVYETMRLVRNYSCLKNGIDPNKVDLMFENYTNPKTHGRASLYKKSSSQGIDSFDDVRGLVTVSTRYPLNSFRNLNNIFHVAFHEMKHITDYFADKNPYRVASKIDSSKPFLKRPMTKNLSKFRNNQITNLVASYNKGGFAWFGSKAETRADKTAFRELERLEIKSILKSENKVEPFKSFVKNSFHRFKIMTKHEVSSLTFGVFQTYSGFKTPEKSEIKSQPNVTQGNDTRSLVSISSIRRVADKNPELFKQEDYLSHVIGREIKTIQDLQISDNKFKEVLKNENDQTVEEITSEETLSKQNNEDSLQEDSPVTDEAYITVNDYVQRILQTRQQMQQAHASTEEGAQGANEVAVAVDTSLEM